MLVVFTTPDLLESVRNILETEPRLTELVAVADLLEQKPDPCGRHLIVRRKSGITQPLDWFNEQPPYLLAEEIDFTPEKLLGLVFAKLGNEDKTSTYLHNDPVLRNDLDIVRCLQQGIPVSPQQLTSDFSPFEEYRFCHNSAILHHYAATEDTFDADKTRYFYREAISSAPNGEYQAFTARQYAIFLIDCHELLQAEHLLQDALKAALSDDAAIELKATLCGVWMKQIVVPYDQALLANLKNTLWEVLQHYQQQQRKLEEGLLLVDAAQVANYSESFAEALGYLNRAIDIFRKEEQPELLAQAQYRKGILLYTWAKQDNPQFFRGALEGFQEALKVFSREETPDVFADIQQYLGVIYAEIPDEVRKKSIWAGISAASFQQALAFYNKTDYPYEYGMVCANYANALTKYPEAIHSDNREKALFYYAEALDVRSAAEWPLERAVTLLNYVETCWDLGLPENGNNQQLYDEMMAKTEEAEALTQDPAILAAAREQLQRLAQLKAVGI